MCGNVNKLFGVSKLHRYSELVENWYALMALYKQNKIRYYDRDGNQPHADQNPNEDQDQMQSLLERDSIPAAVSAAIASRKR